MAEFSKDSPQRATNKEVASKLEDIITGLKENLEGLRECRSIMESKPDLLDFLESYRLDMEIRANELEADVQRLRDDIKSIKELLGLGLKSPKT